ncbi:unnamed protein product [Amoebophrya sp. A120]|nr:unnamed protein product [Amoebophrya sp. A120]|eukprot:GSA120T00002652001.1
MPPFTVFGRRYGLISLDELWIVVPYSVWGLSILALFNLYTLQLQIGCGGKWGTGYLQLVLLLAMLALDLVLIKLSKRGALHDKQGLRARLPFLVELRVYFGLIHMALLVYDLEVSPEPILTFCDPKADPKSWSWLYVHHNEDSGYLFYTSTNDYVLLDHSVGGDYRQVIHDPEVDVRLVANSWFAIMVHSGLIFIERAIFVLFAVLASFSDRTTESPKEEYAFRRVLQERVLREDVEQRTPQERSRFRSLLPSRFRMLRKGLELYRVAGKNISRVERSVMGFLGVQELTIGDFRCGVALARGKEFSGALPGSFLEKGRRINLKEDLDPMLFLLTFVNYAWIAYGYQGPRKVALWDRFTDLLCCCRNRRRKRPGVLTEMQQEVGLTGDADADEEAELQKLERASRGLVVEQQQSRSSFGRSVDNLASALPGADHLHGAVHGGRALGSQALRVVRIISKTEKEQSWERDLTDYMQLLQYRQRQMLQTYADQLEDFDAGTVIRNHAVGSADLVTLTAEDLYSSRSWTERLEQQDDDKSLVAPLLRVMAGRFALGYVAVHYEHLTEQLGKWSDYSKPKIRWVAAIFTVLRLCRHTKRLSVAQEHSQDLEVQRLRASRGLLKVTLSDNAGEVDNFGAMWDPYTQKVTNVVPHSVADQHGILVGDTLQLVDGKPLPVVFHSYAQECKDGVGKVAVATAAGLLHTIRETRKKRNENRRPGVFRLLRGSPFANIVDLALQQGNKQAAPKAKGKANLTRSDSTPDTILTLEFLQPVRRASQQLEPSSAVELRNSMVEDFTTKAKVDNLQGLEETVSNELARARAAFTIKRLDWEYLSPLERQIPAFQALKEAWEAELLAEKRERAAVRAAKRTKWQAKLKTLQETRALRMGFGQEKMKNTEAKLRDLDEESEASAEDDPTLRLNSDGGLAVEEVGVELLYVSPHTRGGERAVFYFAQDNFSNALVIGFRGTMSAKDMVSDAAIAPARLFADSPADEYVHAGFLSCARFALKCLERGGFLRALPSSYSVVCTGHSLGAGCAACLGFLLAKKYPELRAENRLRCLLVAPPGLTCSLKLREESLDYMITLVNGFDGIPRSRTLSIIVERNFMSECLRKSHFSKWELIAGKLSDYKDALWNCWHAANSSAFFPTSPFNMMYARKFEDSRLNPQERTNFLRSYLSVGDQLVVNVQRLVVDTTASEDGLLLTKGDVVTVADAPGRNGIWVRITVTLFPRRAGREQHQGDKEDRAHMTTTSLQKRERISEETASFRGSSTDGEDDEEDRDFLDPAVILNAERHEVVACEVFLSYSDILAFFVWRNAEEAVRGVTMRSMGTSLLSTQSSTQANLEQTSKEVGIVNEESEVEQESAENKSNQGTPGPVRRSSAAGVARQAIPNKPDQLPLHNHKRKLFQRHGARSNMHLDEADVQAFLRVFAENKNENKGDGSRSVHSTSSELRSSPGTSTRTSAGSSIKYVAATKPTGRKSKTRVVPGNANDYNMGPASAGTETTRSEPRERIRGTQVAWFDHHEQEEPYLHAMPEGYVPGRILHIRKRLSKEEKGVLDRSARNDFTNLLETVFGGDEELPGGSKDPEQNNKDGKHWSRTTGAAPMEDTSTEEHATTRKGIRVIEKALQKEKRSVFLADSSESGNDEQSAASATKTARASPLWSSGGFVQKSTFSDHVLRMQRTTSSTGTTAARSISEEKIMVKRPPRSEKSVLRMNARLVGDILGSERNEEISDAWSSGSDQPQRHDSPPSQDEVDHPGKAKPKTLAKSWSLAGLKRFRRREAVGTLLRRSATTWTILTTALQRILQYLFPFLFSHGEEVDELDPDGLETEDPEPCQLRPTDPELTRTILDENDEGPAVGAQAAITARPVLTGLIHIARKIPLHKMILGGDNMLKNLEHDAVERQELIEKYGPNYEEVLNARHKTTLDRNELHSKRTRALQSVASHMSSLLSKRSKETALQRTQNHGPSNDSLDDIYSEKQQQARRDERTDLLHTSVLQNIFGAHPDEVLGGEYELHADHALAQKDSSRNRHLELFNGATRTNGASVTEVSPEDPAANRPKKGIFARLFGGFGENSQHSGEQEPLSSGDEVERLSDEVAGGTRSIPSTPRGKQVAFPDHNKGAFPSQRGRGAGDSAGATRLAVDSTFRGEDDEREGTSLLHLQQPSSQLSSMRSSLSSSTSATAASSPARKNSNDALLDSSNDDFIRPSMIARQLEAELDLEERIGSGEGYYAVWVSHAELKFLYNRPEAVTDHLKISHDAGLRCIFEDFFSHLMPAPDRNEDYDGAAPEQEEAFDPNSLLAASFGPDEADLLNRADPESHVLSRASSIAGPEHDDGEQALVQLKDVDPLMKHVPRPKVVNSNAPAPFGEVDPTAEEVEDDIARQTSKPRKSTATERSSLSRVTTESTSTAASYNRGRISTQVASSSMTSKNRNKENRGNRVDAAAERAAGRSVVPGPDLIPSATIVTTAFSESEQRMKEKVVKVPPVPMPTVPPTLPSVPPSRKEDVVAPSGDTVKRASFAPGGNPLAQEEEIPTSGRKLRAISPRNNK